MLSFRGLETSCIGKGGVIVGRRVSIVARRTEDKFIPYQWPVGDEMLETNSLE